jgi:STAM-binding protein
MLRDETRRREEASSIDEIRFDQLRLTDEDGRHQEREQDGQRRITEQRQQERDGILRRQQEAEYAAQSARLGQPAGQNQSVTMPQAAVPSIPGPRNLAPATSSGPIARHLQMPLESPTRYVIRWLNVEAHVPGT